MTEHEQLILTARFQPTAVGNMALDPDGVYCHHQAVEILNVTIAKQQKRIAELEAENTRLSDLCDKWNSECDEYRVENTKVSEHLDAYIKELLGEPVAWMCSNESLIRLGYKRVADTQFGDWNVPLYALKEQK